MNNQLINGSAHDTGLPDGSIHCIVTSPPYWGLRAYAGDQAVDWPAVDYSPMPGMPPIHVDASTCPLGLEPSIDAYIGHMILVMREMWRVLRGDGTCWANFGDSYAGSGGAGGDYNAGGLRDGQPKYKNTFRPGAGRADGVVDDRAQRNRNGIGRVNGLKPKDLCLVPYRFALAAQADGWWVRQDIIWAKGVSFCPTYAGSSMPSSVQDRPSSSHEHVWLMAKNQRYFYDLDAVREPLRVPNAADGSRVFGGINKNGANIKHGDRTTVRAYDEAPDGRQLRSVWTINPSGYSGSHFAVFPEALVDPIIRLATSQRGVCPTCGAPWERIVERKASTVNLAEGQRQQIRTGGALNGGTQKVTLGVTDSIQRTTTGWQPSCSCNAGDPIPATVLDPFVGSGTTLRVAMRLGRRAIGIDISQEYLDEIVPKRIGNVQQEMTF